MDLAVALVMDDPSELVDAYHRLGATELLILRLFDPHSATSDGARARRLRLALKRSGHRKDPAPQRTIP